MFLVRTARLDDAEDLKRLAALLNTTNLPNQVDEIQDILKQSCDSFSGLIHDVTKRLYLFVLEDLSFGRVIGSSQIIAQHGTWQLPHIYFQIESLCCRSESLKIEQEQKILRLGFNSEGMTELGGLILDPEYRCVPQRLGKALSLVRFAFIYKNQPLFKERLLAELLPPFDEEGNSPLWQALGQHFMSISYRQADHLSRKQKEFIESLFPMYPIYIVLLPKEAQDVIGQVGQGSKPAAHMLETLGFSYGGRVDPFDGGPHYEMNTADLPEIELGSDVEFDVPGI